MQKFQSLKNLGLEFLSQMKIKAKDFDAIVVSPGISFNTSIYQEALHSGIEIIGEVELALRHISKSCIGVTGTNGKTTVTLLLEHVLNKNGVAAKAVGNVGVPLTSMINDPAEVFVIELSSYQLETMHSKVLNIALLLNITPDHLERYGNMVEYAKAKAKIFDCIKEFGNSNISEKCYLDWEELFSEQDLYFYDRDKTILKHIAPKSPHDADNILAAYYICRQFGIGAEQFALAEKLFVKPPHRIEFIKTINGIHFIDDSKGTNIDAVIKAVDSVNGPVILIAGGVDKGVFLFLLDKAF